MAAKYAMRMWQLCECLVSAAIRADIELAGLNPSKRLRVSSARAVLSIERRIICDVRNTPRHYGRIVNTGGEAWVHRRRDNVEHPRNSYLRPVWRPRYPARGDERISPEANSDDPPGSNPSAHHETFLHPPLSQLRAVHGLQSPDHPRRFCKFLYEKQLCPIELKADFRRKCTALTIPAAGMAHSARVVVETGPRRAARGLSASALLVRVPLNFSGGKWHLTKPGSSRA